MKRYIEIKSKQPVIESELIDKHLKSFKTFVQAIKFKMSQLEVINIKGKHGKVKCQKIGQIATPT